MLGFHAGFFVERTDPAIHEISYQVVQEFLAELGEGREYRAMHWLIRAGLPASLLVIGTNDNSTSRDINQWVGEHHGLSGRLARALRCHVFAYTYNEQVGYETGYSYDGNGYLIEQLSASWDDASPRVLERLAERYGVTYGFLAHEMMRDTPACIQPMSHPCDPVLLDDLNAPPTPKTRPELGESMKLMMTESMASEVSAVASALGCHEGAVIESAWELAKHELYATTRNAMLEYDSEAEGPEYLPAPPSRTTPVPLASDAEPSGKLAPGIKVEVSVQLSDVVAAEIQELALHGESSISTIVQEAYRVARDQIGRAHV